MRKDVGEELFALVLVLNEMPDPKLFYSTIVDCGYDFSVIAEIVERRRRELRHELLLLQQELSAIEKPVRSGAAVVPFPMTRSDQYE